VIDALFTEQDRQIIISDLSIIELGSALAKKVREGEITVEKYHRAIGLFCQDVVTETIQVETLGEIDKAEAAALLETHSLRTNLRTLDSLQLAVMKRVSETQLDQVFCADRAFCSLIRKESLTVRNPEEDSLP
jgi:predicted nucleic acid-binding protein